MSKIRSFKRNWLAIMLVILVIACSGGGGSGGGGDNDQDGSANSRPTIASFTADTDTISPGQSVRLDWEGVNGAATLRIDPGVGPVSGSSGSTSVRPAGTTLYTLTATNAAGRTIATLTVTVQGAANTWVQGYYVGYQSELQPPSAVDYNAMTHIVVGAALPQSGGTWNTDFYIGPHGGSAWAHETIERAHTAGIKTLLMLGGAGDETIAAFRETSDPVIRKAFVDNLKTIIDEYAFDGFDVDWEPLELDGPNDDRDRFLAFSQELRAAMPAKIMTFPTGWNNMNLNNALNPYFGTVSAYYDRISMMSYEMLWCGDGWLSWHFGALYGETSQTPSSIEDTVNALRDSGVPNGKISIGIGFYGVPIENGSWQGGIWVPSGPPYVTAPRQNSDQAGWRISDNWATFSNIMRYYFEDGARQWDSLARVPYLSFATPKQISEPAWADPLIQTTYVTYEDEQSVAEKGNYVRAEGLGGTIIWTISNGYLEWMTSGEKDPLMKVVKEAFLE
jgi:chitinase